jgi:hypothetical protein
VICCVHVFFMGFNWVKYLLQICGEDWLFLRCRLEVIPNLHPIWSVNGPGSRLFEPEVFAPRRRGRPFIGQFRSFSQSTIVPITSFYGT